MRKFFLFFLFIPFSLLGQVNQVDSEGLRQGLWEKKGANGRLIYTGYFKEGKPTGNWIRYYSSGNVQAKLSYKDNPDSVITMLYNKTGKKIAEGLYVKQQREGKWSFFSNGLLNSEEEYSQGKRCGIIKKYYATGELLETSEWKGDKKEGVYKVYFKKGIPYLQCNFIGGKRDGRCFSYYDNGTLEMEAYYSKNLRDGEWKYYKRDGEYWYTLKYKNGQILNPLVRDSISNSAIENLGKGKNSIPDPEKFMQDPSGYMMRMQKFR